MNKKTNVVMAIIDSGLDIEHIPNNVLPVSCIKISLLENELILIDQTSEFDDYHGTKVLATISKYGQQAGIECYSFNVFDKGKASSFSVLEALNQCLIIDNLQIIVMSISCSYFLAEEMNKVLEQLKEKKVMVFAATKNGCNTSFPANSPYVYGVNGRMIKKKGGYIYNCNQEIQFLADRGYEFYRFGDSIRVFGGNSKANAIIAGVATRMLWEQEEVVFNTSINEDDIILDFEEDKKFNGNHEIIAKLVDEGIINDNYGNNELIELTDENIMIFLRLLNESGLDVSEKNIEYYDIANCSRLIEYVEEKQKENIK